jgi:hypothetical protein
MLALKGFVYQGRRQSRCAPEPGWTPQRSTQCRCGSARVSLGIALAWALTTVFLSGCRKEGPERVILAGTVTYQGKPVTEGTILFTPAATSQVPSAGASIVDGNYKVDVHGGVPVGTHRISIQAYRSVPFTLPPGQPEPRNYSQGRLRQQYLPKIYNATSQLVITIEPGSGAIAKNFDLTD